MNCKHCGRSIYHCKCERFEIPTIEVYHGPHKYEIVDKVKVSKNPKYRVVLKNGQFVTESISS